MPRGWQEKMRTPPAPAQQAHLRSARHQSSSEALGPRSFRPEGTGGTVGGCSWACGEPAFLWR